MRNCLEGEGQTNNQKDSSRDTRPATLGRIHQLHVRLPRRQDLEDSSGIMMAHMLFSSCSPHRGSYGYWLCTTLLFPLQSVVAPTFRDIVANLIQDIIRTTLTKFQSIDVDHKRRMYIN